MVEASSRNPAPVEEEEQAGASARLDLVVSRTEPVANGCRLIELRAHDDSVLPAAEPGSHIGLHLPGGILRQYSLLEASAHPRTYQIAVKHDANSRGGSAYVCETLEVGDRLAVDPPRNNFPLDEQASESVFFAGGIGITPIWSMLNRLESLGRPWQLYYAARAPEDILFREQLQAFDNVHLHIDQEQGRVFSFDEVLPGIRPDAHLYCCGPAPMLAGFESATADRQADRVHVEYFTQKHEVAVEGGFIVELRQSNKELLVKPGQAIIDVLREADVWVATSCEEGICGACETRVIEGIPDHRDAILSPKEREANKTMFVCCSGSKTPRLVLDL